MPNLKNFRMIVEAGLAAPHNSRVHRFADTGEAYDETQTNDDIHDGDVLVVEPEGVVGILVQAWPVAITAERGHFHVLNAGRTWATVGQQDGRDYTGAYALARREAERRGFPLAGEEPTPTIRPPSL